MSDISPAQLRLTNYFHLMGMTILYYDHLLTIGDEYWKIWRKLQSRGSWYFLLNRYFAFFGNIGVLVGNFYPFGSEKSCTHYTLFRQLVLIISEVIVGANLLLRIYALYGRDKRVLAFVLSVSAVLIGFACWSVIGQKADVTLLEGCHISLDRIKAVRVAVSWEALFVYDALIVSLTLFKAYRERPRRQLLQSRDDLFVLVVRDGATYFAVMAIANLINTITFYTLAPILRGTFATLATSISVTMMSRLIFNLRQGASSNRNNYETTLAPTSIIRFTGNGKRRATTTATTFLANSEATHSAQNNTCLNENIPEDGANRIQEDEDIEMSPITR